MKKALSAATSAALLASLLATAVAPSAFAAVTVGSAGNVPVGGTSANSATFTFTEQSAAAIATNAAGSFTVTICDSSGVAVGPPVACTNAGSLSFSGTPSLATSTGSLGATASIAGNVLTVKIAGSDTANIESIIVTGLKLKAAAGTPTGAITATMGAFTGSLAAGAGIFSGGGTATGTIVGGIGVGATSVIVNVTSAGCNFSATATSGNPLSFATSAETKNITVASGLGTPAAGQQTLTIVATLNVHNAGEIVSETTGCLASTTLASPGTVVAALTYSSVDNATVFPGEFNSPASNLTLVEPSAGFLPAASTFTYTIATAGVVFSTAPSVSAPAVQQQQQTITFTGATANTHAVGTTFTQIQGAPTSCTASGTLVTAITAPVTSVVLTPTTPLCPFLVTAGPVLNGVFTSNTENGPVTVVGAIVSVPVASSLGLSAPVLSADRRSATVTVNTASTVAATITLSNILYDVASTVPAGTFIEVDVATSGGLAVNPNHNTNAVVFRGIAAASATSPTVYIGENNQTAGIVSFTESSAGWFTAGVGTGTNTFQICPSGTTYAFTLAPYAQVVGGVAAGNLILRDGAAASTTNLVQGTNLNNGCYGWTVWTASTTASTIKIGSAGLASGALINVTAAQAPGGVNVALSLGSSNFVNVTLAATVQFATAVYRNQVVVSALSQPNIAAGSVHAAAGNLQIAETGLGQLKAGENICVEVLYRSFVNTDTFLNGLNTADLPVVVASGTGLVIGPVASSAQRCTPDPNVPLVPAGYMQSFSFPVLQQSTAGDGKLVISNINYTTLADAVAGPVQLSVWGMGGAPTLVIFHSTVSNAYIGTAPTTTGLTGIAFVTQTSLGAVKVGTFTNATKVAAFGKYQTWRFAGGPALAGKVIQVWVATKNSAGTWSAFTRLTSRLADSSGNAFFWWRYSTAKWISVRAMYPGDATHIASWGVARQGRWM